MSRHNSLKDLSYEALSETLCAAEILIGYDKGSIKGRWSEGDNGGLGYPAAVLLFSFIETVGCIWINKGKGNSFKVLREPIFGSQPLSEHLCTMVYATYRNKLAHNLALPQNVYLQIDDKDPRAFNVTNTDKGGKEAVNAINLHALLVICKRAFESLPEVFDEKFGKADQMKYIGAKDLEKSEPPFAFIRNPSGYTSLE
ncbi:MAG: hypothetical protein JST90_14790 [Bacteroidetes bacterium]|nr:hypothetical protein [Bacteroidota bacterium]